MKISFHKTTVNALNNISVTELSGEYEQTIPLVTINKTIYKYDVEQLYFALTTNTKRILKTIHFLKFWATLPGIKCLIVFEKEDFLKNRNITELLMREGIPCRIIVSNVKYYEKRYLQLFHYAWESQNMNESNAIQWFAVGDDDTIWFIDNLLDTLRQYDSSQNIYLGNISDRKRQIIYHGSFFAYGGGGILLSRPLTLLYSKHIHKSNYFLNTKAYGGDGMIGKYIADILKVNLTGNIHFLQMDHFGDMTGYLESGIDGFVSFHHMYSLWQPFPNNFKNDINKTMHILKIGYNTFERNFLKRYVRFNRKLNQTFLLTLGYSFSIFNRILSITELDQVENTWHGTEMTSRISRPNEPNKITWYFRNVTYEMFHGSKLLQAIYQNKQFQTINMLFMN
ncbi:hypothetical protein I4U23_012948 [Adineta vaga]|nr:hypothetical protein I4U23_012948 [Adineta vaga]